MDELIKPRNSSKRTLIVSSRVLLTPTRLLSPSKLLSQQQDTRKKPPPANTHGYTHTTPSAKNSPEPLFNVACFSRAAANRRRCRQGQKEKEKKRQKRSRGKISLRRNATETDLDAVVLTIPLVLSFERGTVIKVKPDGKDGQTSPESHVTG